jgi:outer membrane protein TolC
MHFKIKAPFLATLSIFTLGTLAALGATRPAHAAPLSLDDFIADVRAKNNAYQGAQETRQGSESRTRQADLLTSPSLFANYQHESDAKLPVLPSFSYDRLTTDNFNLGVSEQFGFGLQAKIYYAYDYTNYVNASIPGVTGLDPSYFTPRDARPVIELSMPLLGGGFGRTVRANQEQIQAQAKADRSTAEYQIQGILVQAESAYWQLATSRDIVAIEERAVEQAQATYDYNSRKAKMNLAESSDVLQSEAALANAKLSLKSARDNERAAERAFNTVRNAAPDSIPEALAPLNWDAIESSAMTPKQRPANRADVDAATAQVHVTQANSKIAIENDKPTLEVYGSYGLNGRSYSGFNDALSNSFDSGRSTGIAGLRFNMPLNFGAQSEARHGAELQSLGAERRLQQTLADQEQQWNDLINKLSDAESQFHYARIIEGVQKKKLENETHQLRRGRSTTFQVLQFEQDYTNAQLTRAQVGAQVLNLRSQLKYYEPVNGPRLRSSKL